MQSNTPIVLIITLLISVFIISCDSRYSKNKIPPQPIQNGEFYKDALTALDKQIETDKSNDIAYYKKANILLLLKDTLEAVSAINKALEIEKNNPEYYKILAISTQNSDPQKALEAITRAASLGLNSPSAIALEASLLQKTGQSQKAFEKINAAIRLDTNNTYNYLVKGFIFLALKDTVEAEKFIFKSLARGNHYPEAYNSLINIYTFKKDHSEALVFINKNLEKNPDNLALLTKKATTLKNMGMLDSASVVLKYVLQNDSSSFEANNLMAFISFENKDYLSADLYGRRALNENGNSKLTLFVLARTQDKLKNYALAKEYYTKILSIDPTYKIAREGLTKLEEKIAYLQKLKAQNATAVERRNSQLYEPVNIQPKQPESTEITQ